MEVVIPLASYYLDIKGPVMQIKTSISTVNDTSFLLKKIAHFWDKISVGWKEIWGPHIHHGYYDTSDPITPVAAQECLIERLCELVKPCSQDFILDVGCGMGGSALYIAEKYHSSVVGISLSQRQLTMARDSYFKTNHHQTVPFVEFRMEDAHTLKSFTDNTFDIVWSLESCEQFYDKRLFIQQANRVLKPGGKLMLATWCSDQELYQGTLAKNYLSLCKAFDLPYMPTMNWYAEVLNTQFSLHIKEDWSNKVKDSWDIGIAQLRKHSLLSLLSIGGWTGMWFVRQLKQMSHAFQSGQLQYGVFVAQKQI